MSRGLDQVLIRLMVFREIENLMSMKEPEDKHRGRKSISLRYYFKNMKIDGTLEEFSIEPISLQLWVLIVKHFMCMHTMFLDQ
jgi:hypothetical protein